ncbi:hypothetical protein KSP40_PGU018766 [Platanthera guangdongensis]|uniref:RanBP2-type domain-containing protein n=1 Tax=Platanthera guangdongensis TaxID=2320717 RepID=A0ABR2LJL3_9ASPA
MAFSKIFQLRSSFLLRPRVNLLAFSQPPFSLCSTTRLLLKRRFPFAQFQQLQLFSAASTVTIEDTEAAGAAHPWPEWDQFVKKIMSKGYFDASSSETVDEEGEVFPEAASPALGSRGTAMDANKLKNACLKFARDRFDILRSLPKEEIRAVVESGCPNLFRKSVNSSKRLRAFLRLNEADVCSACSLRGSCDRAYFVVHEEEGARTLDIMRVLLSYACNPNALLGGESSSVKVPVQESARRILSEIIKLSDTIIDPALTDRILNIANQKRSSSQPNTTIRKNMNDQDIEMKKGDWLCPNCNFLNFSRNVRCRECKAEGPKRVDTAAAAKMKPGDWTCPRCDFMNFARNTKCFRCIEQRPQRDLNPGEWECPGCDFLNFSRNEVCRKCSQERPAEEGSGSKDRVRGKRGDAAGFTFGGSEDEASDSEDDSRRGGDIWPSSSHMRRSFSARKRELSS